MAQVSWTAAQLCLSTPESRLWERNGALSIRLNVSLVLRNADFGVPGGRVHVPELRGLVLQQQLGPCREDGYENHWDTLALFEIENWKAAQSGLSLRPSPKWRRAPQIGGVDVFKLQTAMLAQAGCPTIRLPASHDTGSDEAALEVPQDDSPLPGAIELVVRIYSATIALALPQRAARYRIAIVQSGKLLETLVRSIDSQDKNEALGAELENLRWDFPVVEPAQVVPPPAFDDRHGLAQPSHPNDLLTSGSPLSATMEAPRLGSWVPAPGQSEFSDDDYWQTTMAGDAVTRSRGRSDPLHRWPASASRRHELLHGPPPGLHQQGYYDQRVQPDARVMGTNDAVLRRGERPMVPRNVGHPSHSYMEETSDSRSGHATATGTHGTDFMGSPVGRNHNNGAYTRDANPSVQSLRRYSSPTVYVSHMHGLPHAGPATVSAMAAPHSARANAFFVQSPKRSLDSRAIGMAGNMSSAANQSHTMDSPQMTTEPSMPVRDVQNVLTAISREKQSIQGARNRMRQLSPEQRSIAVDAASDVLKSLSNGLNSLERQLNRALQSAMERSNTGTTSSNFPVHMSETMVQGCMQVLQIDRENMLDDSSPEAATGEPGDPVQPTGVELKHEGSALFGSSGTDTPLSPENALAFDGPDPAEDLTGLFHKAMEELGPGTS